MLKLLKQENFKKSPVHNRRLAQWRVTWLIKQNENGKRKQRQKR